MMELGNTEENKYFLNSLQRIFPLLRLLRWLAAVHGG
jgi:hypothetical protein